MTRPNAFVSTLSLVLLALGVHPGIGRAQWVQDGVPVSTASLAGEEVPTIISDGAGGTIITWYQHQDGGDNNIFVQRLNGLGVAQWTANGLPICVATGDQVYPQIITDGAGGAIVTWLDNRNGNWDIYVQRVDAAGVPQWYPDGEAIAANVTCPYGPVTIADGAGGAIVAWTQTNGANIDIYAQRVDASGFSQWGFLGLAICTAPQPQQDPALTSDGAGGAIVTWQDGRSGANDIYAQRVNAAGAVQWVANGVALCTSANDQVTPAIVADGAGGAIVAWADFRSATNYDLYAQRVNASGVAQWAANGKAVCTSAGNQVGPEIVTDGVGGAIIAWNDRRNGSDYDLYAQRVNSSGTAQWAANGVVVCAAPDDEVMTGDIAPDHQIVADGVGGAFMTWKDRRVGNASDIYAQRVNSSGAMQLPANGVAVCTALLDQDWPAIAYNGAGGAVVAWEDNRNVGLHVYALPVSNTPFGHNVSLSPFPCCAYATGSFHPMSLTFSNVTSDGYTSLDENPSGPPLPPSFIPGDGTYYILSTTATSTDNIDVCIQVDTAALPGPFDALRVLQHAPAGSNPEWVDITSGFNAAEGSVCGTTQYLSTFVIGFGSVSGVGNTPGTSYALYDNVPNPFNPITTIRYDVPRGGADVNISIYDVSGRLVRELVNEHRDAGNWSAQWNGADDRGARVGSGVYFYRMRAGAFVETKKMVLLK